MEFSDDIGKLQRLMAASSVGIAFDLLRASQPDKSNSTIPLFSGSLKAGSVFKWSKKTTNP